VCWFIYVGKASAVNFEISLERGIWGSINDCFGDLQQGDEVIFAHAISSQLSPAMAGFPRVGLEHFRGPLKKIVRCTLNSNPYISSEIVWTDKEYPYRFDFTIHDSSEDLPISDVFSDDEIIDKIRLSLLKQSRPEWANYSFSTELAVPFEDDDNPIDEDNDRKGWVYVISNQAWEDWVKIGCTVNPAKRFDNYNTYSPLRNFEHHCWKRCEKAYESEQRIHTHLRNKLPPDSCEYEWFKITPHSAEEVLRQLLGENDFAYLIPD
jgi:hypothetical protein